jgi:ankyrin repeat protein
MIVTPLFIIAMHQPPQLKPVASTTPRRIIIRQKRNPQTMGPQAQQDTPTSIPVAKTETIKLISSDNKEYSISKKSAELSGTIKHLISDIGESNSIPFNNISSNDLEIIINHLKSVENLYIDPTGKYNSRQARINLRPLIKNLTPLELTDFLIVANYLDIQPLINAYSIALILAMPEYYYTASNGLEKKVNLQKNFLQSYFTNLLKDTNNKALPVGIIDSMLLMQKDVEEEFSSRNRNTKQLFRLLAGKRTNQNAIKMKQIIEDGINLNMQENGETPLIKAIIYNYYDIALDLINAGADVNIASYDGRTPLMKLAAGSDVKGEPCPHMKIFNALLKAKANLDAKDKANKTALSIAITVVHKPIISALQQVGAK